MHGLRLVARPEDLYHGLRLWARLGPFACAWPCTRPDSQQSLASLMGPSAANREPQADHARLQSPTRINTINLLRLLHSAHQSRQSTRSPTLSVSIIFLSYICSPIATIFDAASTSCPCHPAPLCPRSPRIHRHTLASSTLLLRRYPPLPQPDHRIPIPSSWPASSAANTLSDHLQLLLRLASPAPYQIPLTKD